MTVLCNYTSDYVICLSAIPAYYFAAKVLYNISASLPKDSKEFILDRLPVCFILRVDHRPSKFFTTFTGKHNLITSGSLRSQSYSIYKAQQRKPWL
jgi:hypothetical protein